ncbi:hypothetical protein [Candidatus Symbiopectobacterium sp. 'North America']|uniref:hypothetical protein n=1 Tax=Candidatus Symbiopectobacterium sp. 'North America' TaxID=2794574 RepID=UPI001FD40B95|nr:hypothetical protein [Candidatus Symbiopectobacterium sp. 'North America']
MSHSRIKPVILKLQELSATINALQQELALSEEESRASVLDNQIQSLTDFGTRLNARRKALGIDLSTLELQTGVSISTLKRLFKRP